MTYHTLKCPHCRKVINWVTGSPDYIGNPIRKCPWCGGLYIDSFTREWVTKSPYKRFMFLIEKPFAGAFLSFILIAGILFMAAKVNIIISLIVGAVIAIAVFIVWYFVRKPSIREEIGKSIERTKSAKYVALLKNAGLKIYKIKGVEIGTINDEENSSLQDIDIKKEKDSSLTLY